jgi:hypothetical protein|nr:MAG TPA: hypothetical protein [Caudoviricetes sp.]
MIFIILIIKLILQTSRDVGKLASSDAYYTSNKDTELLETPKA